MPIPNNSPLFNNPLPQDIAGVIALMGVLDTQLQPTEGLKWFNLLYKLVTEHVYSGPPAGGWHAQSWLTRLDVIFAGYYFKAVQNYLTNNGPVAQSWQALFERQSDPSIDRMQFALAGMNAHINHDLALALLQTDAEFNIVPALQSLQHDDFETVNQLLSAALPQALEFLHTGVWGPIIDATGLIGRMTALWNVTEARDLAWYFADHLRGLSPLEYDAAIFAQDKLTGVIGRALLSL